MAHQPIGSVPDIQGRCAHGVVQVPLVHRARVVRPERLVVVSILRMELLQPGPVLGALSAVSDHLEDRGRRVVGVPLGAVVGLHEAWVADAVVGLLQESSLILASWICTSTCSR